jgi:succinate-semialdehyde dehydrogenase/glutarate-semialdehyde dehydrogenase
MAGIAPEVLSDIVIDAGFRGSRVVHEPLGTVFSIMPWNFPMWQFFRFAVPAMLAGNAVVLKHAPSTIGCGMMAARLCHLAGIPEELVADLRIDVEHVEAVIADDRIHAVTFTGSTTAGSTVAALAGKHLKKSVMELGGSDPYIICHDADVDVAAAMCATGRTINSGQSCIAAKRFIVHESIANEFVRRVQQRFDSMIVGNPLDSATEIGPLARHDLKQLLLDQLQRALQAGARRVTHRDAEDAGMEGYYVYPTLLVDVDASNPAFREELFGPVATVTTFIDEHDAIDMANASSFGLGAAVCSQDLDRASSIARKLECGTVFVNDFVRSDARLPFGGVKKSGYGRELGRWGMLEFVNVKNVTIG